MTRVRTNIEIEDAYVRPSSTASVSTRSRGHQSRTPTSRRSTHDSRRGAGDPRSTRHRHDPQRCRSAKPGVILVDTSAWVEYDRATASPVDRRVAEIITIDAQVAVTEPVVMEVLAGARSDERQADLRRLLLRFGALALRPHGRLRCRGPHLPSMPGVGVTPRGMIDCMVASVAHRSGASLLALDADLTRLADVVGIEMDEASRLV